MAGNFVRVNGVARGGIARLHTDGSLDLSFDPGLGIWTRDSDYGRTYGSIESLVAQPDGQIVILGPFNTVNGAAVRHLARLNGDPAHRFVNLVPLPTGTLELELTGRADRPQVIEASPDLKVWTPIHTNAPAMRFSIEDNEALAFPNRFYRSRRE